MIQLTSITNAASQEFSITSETGNIINFALRFLPRVNKWVFDCASGNLNIKGAALTFSPNVLRGYRNVIDFGLMCLTTDGQDPYFLSDFAINRVTLYLLNPSDVINVESGIFQ